MTPRSDAPATPPARLDQPKTSLPSGPDPQAQLQVARQIYRGKSVAEVVHSLVLGARELAGCDQAGFYAAGRDEDELRLAAGATLAAAAARTLPRATLDQGSAGERAAAAIWATPPEASATYTVIGARGAHGLLVCGWGAPAGRPTSWAITLAELAADAGHALDRLGGSPWPDDQGDTFGAINAITDIGLLYGNLIERLLHAILEQIIEVMGIGAGAIFLYDEQSAQLDLAHSATGSRLGAHAQAARALWQAPTLALSTAHAASVARSGRSERVSADQIGAPLAAAQLSELVSVPLLAGGWLTGVIQVVPLPGREVAPAQLGTLNLLARQAAVAIENARLFTQARADQERTSAVVDATNDAILMLDERRRTMIINRRARFFFGLAERDLIGKDYDQISAIFSHIFADGQRFNSWLAQLLRSRTTRTVEEFRTARPESRLLQCFSAPVTDQHDRFLGRILVFRDITREREVDRMKNDFVSIVSHELRTPLTSIQGALQLILGQPALGRAGFTAGMSQRAIDLLTISLNNTARLIRLINDILDIAKIEQGRIQMHREPIDPAAICRSAADEVAALAGGRDIAIGLQLVEPLPLIYVDRDRAVQVLVNLLSNAIKFSASGQRVLLSARRDGGMVHFAVRDWGRGIAVEDQARLFQKFQQIDSSSTRDVGGTGLGLAISRALVEEHGGRMWLESAPAAGSTFSFTLPVAEPARLPEESGPLVLLAAEAPQEALPAALRAAGLRVSTVEPAQVVELAQALRPDLLLVELPAGAAGGELLRAVRADPATQTLSLIVLGDEAELPREVALLPRHSAPAAVAAAAKAALSAPRALVLVVDDDPHVRPVLVRLLQRQGLRVSQASDGYSALETAIRLRPQVILLDIKMPGIDGYEVLRRLRATPATADIKVIILTASDERTRVQARELQADDYLEKPIAVERLFGAISRVLARSESRDG
jgi:PAS domain S-box-containing protein